MSGAILSFFLVSFAGLSGSALLGALGAAAVVVAGLYVLQLRRRKRVVPFLEIWQRLLRRRKATAWRSRLQRLLSFLISLLIIFSLILALSDPHAEDEKLGGRSFVVIVDVSASMAESVDGKSRLARSQERVQSWFKNLGPGDEVLLVEWGARPRPLDAFSGDVEVLKTAVEKLRVLDVAAPLAPALALAKDALKGRKYPEIILVSDGAFREPPASVLRELPSLRFASAAEKKDTLGENIQIISFSARRYPLSADRFEVLVEIKNSSTESALLELLILEAGEKGEEKSILDLRNFTLAPQEKITRVYKDLAHAQWGLIAKVRRTDGKEDNFPRDNIARTILSPRKPLSLLVVGEANHFLEAALLIEESLEVRRVSAENYPSSAAVDLTIFDGVFPPRSPHTHAALYFGTPKTREEKKNYPLEIGDKLKMFGFDTWDKNSPVFRLLDPYDIQVLVGHELLTQKQDKTLGASDGKSILVRGKRLDGDFLALGFSPRDSDFVLRTVWPLFVINAVESLVPRDGGLEQLSLKTGTTWRPRVLGNGTTATIIGPLRAGKSALPFEVPVEEGRAIFFGQEAGFYEVKTKEGSQRFAASMFESQESSFLEKDELALGDVTAQQMKTIAPRTQEAPWLWLLLGVFAVSFFEWWSYHQRWTV